VADGVSGVGRVPLRRIRRSPWRIHHDAILQCYREAGLDVLPFLFMTAPHASSPPADITNRQRRMFYLPSDDSEFAEYAFQTAARYGTRPHPVGALRTPDGQSGLGWLTVYEIWNEPNLSDPR